MGKKTPKIPVDDYYMSIHFGFCYPVDRVVSIEIDEKTVWEGAMTESTELFVSNRSLFGGDQRNGGISGYIDVLFGDDDQVLTETQANKLTEKGARLTSATAPGFRGFLSAWFRGAGIAPELVTAPGGTLISALLSPIIPRFGFLWGTNNPIIPAPAMRVQRASKGFLPDLQIIELGKDRKDTNPAHMIYECCVNTDFGSGMSPAQIDMVSFEATAETLFDENFGLSTTWSKEGEVEEFVQSILTHINAVLFTDPRTGLLALRLIRGDYVQENLPVFGPDDLTVDSFDRKARGEIVNVYTLTYKNPITLNEETVTAVDEAGIAMQNGLEINGSGNFPMIRDATLGLVVAERELRANAAPLASGSCIGRRKLAALTPGDLFILRYPELSLSDGEEVVCRVTEIDRGAAGTPSVVISWIEDLFALPSATVTEREPTAWVDPSELPAPLAHQQAFTIPYVLATQVPNIGIDEDDFPDVIVGILGDQRGSDTQGIAIFAETVTPAGTPIAESLGTVPLTDRVTLSAPVVAEAQTAALQIAAPSLAALAPGDLLMLGFAEDLSELCMVTGAPTYSAGVATVPVARGVLDTTPKPFATGTQVWVISQDFSSWDIQPRTATVSVPYTLLPQTSLGLLAEADATPLTYTPTSRPYRPSRPANVFVGGVSFGAAEFLTEPTTVAVSWANRNRLTEDALVRLWGDASVAPEVGQTTVLEIVNPVGDIVSTIDGLTGDSHDVPIASFGNGPFYYIRVLSERDGLRSFQGHEVGVSFPNRTGYGLSYGRSYGE